MATHRTRRTVGTGITERTIEQVTVTSPFGPADRKGIEDLLAGSWLALQKADGRQVKVALRRSFEDHAKHIEPRAKAILQRGSSSPSQTDSRENFANRSLDLVQVVRRFIEIKDAGAAAYWALKLGAVVMQEEMKFAHEPDALTGSKQRRTLSLTRERANKARRTERARNWASWQKEADQIWAVKPALSKNAVASAIKKKLGLTDKIETIAARIRKTPKAG